MVAAGVVRKCYWYAGLRKIIRSVSRRTHNREAAQPVEKDYLPELAPGEPPLSQGQKDKLFERAY